MYMLTVINRDNGKIVTRIIKQFIIDCATVYRNNFPIIDRDCHKLKISEHVDFKSDYNLCYRSLNN